MMHNKKSIDNKYKISNDVNSDSTTEFEEN